MTLTLDIPADLDAFQRMRLARVLYDSRTLPADQAAALAGLPLSEFVSLPAYHAELRQGSPEWKALLHRSGPARGVVLPLEATSREAIYED